MAPLLGPVWNRDGSPMLVESLGRSGNRPRDGMRTLLIVDDYGNAVAHVRRCHMCLVWKPLDFDNFTPSPSNGKLQMQSNCRACTKYRTRVMKRRDPDKWRAQQRDGWQRRCHDPDYRQRLLEAGKRSREERQRRDPEKMRAQKREANRRYLARLKADTERLQRHNEARRIAYRLLREREAGIDPADIRRITAHKGLPGDIGHKAGLPGAEIAAAIRNEAKRRNVDLETFCESIGFAARALSRWEAGEGVSVRIVDQVLTNLSLNWWEIYSEGEAYAAAHRVFEGEDLAA